MKKLLFILLASLSLNSFSQDKIYKVGDLEEYGEIYIHDSTLMDLNLIYPDWSNPDTSYFTCYNIAEAGIYLMVSEYEKYEEICYNDSVFTEVPYYCDRVGYLVNHYPIKKWHHPSPTFEGFMQYLKTKFNYGK